MVPFLLVMALLQPAAGEAASPNASATDAPPTLIWASQPTFPGETMQLWGGGLLGAANATVDGAAVDLFDRSATAAKLTLPASLLHQLSEKSMGLTQRRTCFAPEVGAGTEGGKEGGKGGGKEGGKGGAAEGSPRMHASEPNGAPEGGAPQGLNPVAVAVSLSILCTKESLLHLRDARAMRRLIHASAAFELVACGLLHGATVAAAQAEEDRQYNPWRMGKEKIDPSVVLDHFVQELLENSHDDFEITMRLSCDYHLISMWLPCDHHVIAMRLHA